MDVITPLTVAWERMVETLFRPFRPEGWLLLAFSAWLAGFQNGEEGSISNPFGLFGKWQKILANSAPGKHAPVAPPQFDWATTHPGLLVALFVGIALAVVGVIALFFWLGFRGQFMFLDNVLHKREEIRRPWREFRRRANSLWRFYLTVLLAGLSLGVILIVIMFGVIFLTHASRLSSHSSAGMVFPLLALLVWFVLWIILAIWMLFVRDFGILWLYRNGGTAWEAARKITQLATEHPLDFILYFLVRFALGLSILIIRFMVGCVTCCIGMFPYVGNVLTLPLSVFRVWYAVECFAQFGPEYDVRPGAIPPPLAPPGLP